MSSKKVLKMPKKIITMQYCEFLDFLYCAKLSEPILYYKEARKDVSNKMVS